MSERVALSALFFEHKGEEPVGSFEAWRKEPTGEWWPMKVTAVLDLTVTFCSLTNEYDTGVLRFDRVFVEPERLTWKERAQTGSGKHVMTWRRRPTGPATDAQRKADREAADLRAQQNKEEVARANAAEDQREARRLQRDRNEQLRQARSAEIIPLPLTKRCPTCKLDKPRDAFPPGKGYSACNDCRSGQVTRALSGQVDAPRPRAGVGLCVRCGSKGRLDDEGVCTRHYPRAKRADKPVDTIVDKTGPEIPEEAAIPVHKISEEATPEGVPPILARRRAALEAVELVDAEDPERGVLAHLKSLEPSNQVAKPETPDTAEKPEYVIPGEIFTGDVAAESPLENQPDKPQPVAASVVTRVARNRTRPEGCVRSCRPFRDDAYHAPGCPHRLEQLEKYGRKAVPTPGCRACEAPGRGIRHAVGCPHRRGPLSNAEMVALAAGQLQTVGATTADPATATQTTALALTESGELAPLPALDHTPTRDDWLVLLVRLRTVVAENRVLKTSLRELYSDLHEVLDS